MSEAEAQKSQDTEKKRRLEEHMAKLARNPRFKVQQGTGESFIIDWQRAAETGQTLTESLPSGSRCPF
jgi:hypothetical protein